MVNQVLVVGIMVNQVLVVGIMNFEFENLVLSCYRVFIHHIYCFTINY